MQVEEVPFLFYITTLRHIRVLRIHDKLKQKLYTTNKHCLLKGEVARTVKALLYFSVRVYACKSSFCSLKYLLNYIHASQVTVY